MIRYSGGSLGKPVGPLPMHPAAEDNYGYDACAVLCLPCVPNILVIATESGTLYHCVVLEGEEEEDPARVPTQHRRSHKPKARIAFTPSNPEQRWADYRSQRTETSPATYPL
ncbi:UNVERIFIED_CONTAM: hypothetical protein FKN15_066929 [Acipenser sinensis]